MADEKKTTDAATPAAVPSWLQKILEILEALLPLIPTTSKENADAAAAVSAKIADLKTQLPK
jgi:hypothetical protein